MRSLNASTLRLRISDMVLRRNEKTVPDEKQLECWRREIDELDDLILKALELRARSVREIGRYKKQHGLPIMDSARERLILNRVVERTRLLPTDLSGEIFGTIIQRMREWESTLD